MAILIFYKVIYIIYIWYFLPLGFYHKSQIIT